MAKRARRPHLPKITELAQARRQELKQLAEAFRRLPGWAEGIILGLLLQVPARRRKALAELVDALILDGPPREIREGRKAAKTLAVDALRAFRFDPRQGGTHSETVLRLHAGTVWSAVEGRSVFLWDGQAKTVRLEAWPRYPLHGRRVSLAQRTAWLRQHLPKVLAALKPACGQRCRKVTVLPQGDALTRIVDQETVSGLVSAIVAYHHGLTLSQVADRFARRSRRSRRSPSPPRIVSLAAVVRPRRPPVPPPPTIG